MINKSYIFTQFIKERNYPGTIVLRDIFCFVVTSGSYTVDASLQ